MGDNDRGSADDAVDAGMDDRDKGDAELKTYECENCGHRMKAEHQPETCPVCGGDMIDLSVSRE